MTRRDFPALAHAALGDTQLRHNIGRATTTIRARTQKVADELPDWEALRDAGSAIKAATLARLDTHLLQLERTVTAAGGTVHWARDAAEAQSIIVRIAQSHGATRAIKIKSMTTDEIDLNPALSEAGIEPIETDLADMIVQLLGDKPSHILVPAIHKNRAEIRELFEAKLGQGKLSDKPTDLTAAARAYLRELFLTTEIAISGANFAIAETGSVCVVESEGNGRMCLTLPRVLITLMGIEKVLPQLADLEVFLQLLPRAATGERANPYTSLWTGVHAGDGPSAFHLVLLDNGRSRILADRDTRETLACIRCSRCLNVCPVYARTGGHAYDSMYQGPIGAILTPQLRGLDAAGSLPFASTLCGACAEVCPVKIDIPRILVHLRNEVVRTQRGPLNGERLAMQAALWVFGGAGRMRLAQRAARLAQMPFAEDGVVTSLPGVFSGWTETRDLPAVPAESFREWWEGRKQSFFEKKDQKTFEIKAHKEQKFFGPFFQKRTASLPSPARDQMLAALRAARPLEDPPGVARNYRQTLGVDRAALIARMTARLIDYGVSVSRAADDSDIASIAAARGLEHIVVPPGLPAAWRPPGAREDDGLTPAQLNEADGAMTGCLLAIAESGTIVLDGGALSGRRALSLLPDTHLCVVHTDQIVGLLPEAMPALSRAVAAGPVTFFSGPSATADIELERVQGVHGPRHLEVILVGP